MSSVPALIPDLPPPLPPLPAPGRDGTAAAPPSESQMRAAAREFEAVFLGEMLRLSGLADVPDGFGGGVGEEGFAGLLVDEYARAIAATRPFGIAEQVYRALAARVHA